MDGVAAAVAGDDLLARGKEIMLFAAVSGGMSALGDLLWGRPKKRPRQLGYVLGAALFGAGAAGMVFYLATRRRQA